MNGMRLLFLPNGKKAEQVFVYLFKCAKSFIIDAHAGVHNEMMREKVRKRYQPNEHLALVLAIVRVIRDHELWFRSFRTDTRSGHTIGEIFAQGDCRRKGR